MSLRSLPFDDPGEPDTRSGFRFLVWLQRQQLRGQVTAMAWCTLFMAGLAALPAAVGMGVQAVVDRSGGGLALAGGLVLGLGAVIAVSDSFTHRSVVANWITTAVRIQQLLSRKAADLGAVLTRRVAAGEVVAVSTGDVEKIGWFVECLARFAAAVLACVALTVALMIYQPLLGVAVAVAVPVLAVAVLPLLPAAVQRADDQRAKAGRATELASDTVAGLRVLRGIGGEELFLSRYRTASQEVRAAAVRSARMWALITAVQVALPGLFLVFIVWYGVRLVLEGRITVGELVTCYGCITYLLMPLRMFEETAMAWTFSRVSANRAARVLGLRRTAGHAEAAGRPGRGTIAADGPPAGGTGTGGTGPGGTCADGTGTGATGTDGTRAHAERAVATGAEPMHGAVIDRAVISGFAPGGAEGDGFALGGLVDPASGLAVPAGSFTAVVCGDPDAAGRLADRLGGHSPEADAEPSVLLGGVALDALPLDTARSAVLVQDKDPVLLSGTLRELLGVPASGKVTAGDALGAAQCADVLSVLAQTLPGGPGDPMDARLTERGRSLSGGQRQRLALARSLVVDPPVLVLDEPTSAVDAHTEARIAHGLRRVRTGRTTVVFASSPLLLDRADHVVFLREGRAVASGRHRELLRTERAYRAVVTRQEETGDERPPDTAGASGAGGATEGVPGPPHSERARAAAAGGTATAGTADPAAGTGAAGGADRVGPPARTDQTGRTDRESLEESA